jgi:hypothetical protein
VICVVLKLARRVGSATSLENFPGTELLALRVLKESNVLETRVIAKIVQSANSEVCVELAHRVP